MQICGGGIQAAGLCSVSLALDVAVGGSGDGRVVGGSLGFFLFSSVFLGGFGCRHQGGGGICVRGQQQGWVPRVLATWMAWSAVVGHLCHSGAATWAGPWVLVVA